MGGGGAGDGVFLVWPFVTWGQPVLLDEHWFSVLPPGWSVDFRKGQYRAVWLGRSVGRPQLGNME